MSLRSLRAQAFQVQHGRCYYCSQPMWQRSPTEVSLPAKLGRWYQCTAEHLLARQDGGRDTSDNVVAACLLCNLRRHKRAAPAPSPEAYRALVQRRIAAGRWRIDFQRTPISVCISVQSVCNDQFDAT